MNNGNGTNPQDMDDLKSFQRDTVEYVFKRLYLHDPPSLRFLIADEVGLGKTMVARGLIQKTIEHIQQLPEPVHPINIIYMCSNANIAGQNIKRLNVTGHPDVSFASRPTVLPFQVHELNLRPVNLISFTPGTAFQTQAGVGQVRERALLYHLLNEAWQIDARPGSQTVLRGGVHTNYRFRAYLHKYCTFDKTLI